MRIDLCYILNELDLLEIRFEILDNFVDRFIVIESTLTFSGHPNTPCFDINDSRWDRWKHKIQHYVVSDYPNDPEVYKMAENSPCTGNGEHWWMREFYIKESARKALLGIHDDDIVFISDVDEIWNPKHKYVPTGDEVLKPRQLPYLEYFNQRTSESWLGWTGTTVCRYEVIRNGIINHIRADEFTKYTVIENGGWHFNAIGGKQKKTDASMHQVANTAEDWKRREVGQRIDESELPHYLIENKARWQHYFI